VFFKQRFHKILCPQQSQLQRVLLCCLHGTRRCWLQVYLGRRRWCGIGVKCSDLQCFGAKECVKNGNLGFPDANPFPKLPQNNQGCPNSSNFNMYAMHTLTMRPIYAQCISSTLYIRCKLAVASPKYGQKLGAQRRITNFLCVPRVLHACTWCDRGLSIRHQTCSYRRWQTLMISWIK